MVLSPDEIAHRSFTPSADGYHQGEVRVFLERIAAELAEVKQALAQVADAATLTPGDDQAASQQAPAPVAPEASGNTGDEPVDDSDIELVIDTLDDHEQRLARLETQLRTTAERFDTAEQTPPPAPSTASAPPPPPPPPPAPSTASAPAAGAAADVSASAPANDAHLTPALFSDLDAEPTISDNANHLLDDVLDDVMGTFTEGSDSP